MYNALYKTKIDGVPNGITIIQICNNTKQYSIGSGAIQFSTYSQDDPRFDKNDFLSGEAYPGTSELTSGPPPSGTVNSLQTWTASGPITAGIIDNSVSNDGEWQPLFHTGGVCNLSACTNLYSGDTSEDLSNGLINITNKTSIE